MERALLGRLQMDGVSLLYSSSSSSSSFLHPIMDLLEIFNSLLTTHHCAVVYCTRKVHSTLHTHTYSV